MQSGATTLVKNIVLCHIEDTHWGNLTPLQRGGQYILHPQLTGSLINMYMCACIYIYIYFEMNRSTSRFIFLFIYFSSTCVSSVFTFIRKIYKIKSIENKSTCGLIYF